MNKNQELFDDACRGLAMQDFLPGSECNFFDSLTGRYCACGAALRYKGKTEFGFLELVEAYGLADEERPYGSPYYDFGLKLALAHDDAIRQNKPLIPALRSYAERAGLNTDVLDSLVSP